MLDLGLEEIMLSQPNTDLEAAIEGLQNNLVPTKITFLEVLFQ